MATHVDPDYPWSDDPDFWLAQIRDPHPAWWIEYRQINAELDTWEYAHPDDPADDSPAWQARSDRSNELYRLLCTTKVTTFEGAQVVFDVLRHEMEDGADHLVNEAVHELLCFLMSIDSALENHGLKDRVEWWFWRQQCAEASVWDGHPRQKIGSEFWTRKRMQDKAAA